jgi:hypothetical protein
MLYIDSCLHIVAMASKQPRKQAKTAAKRLCPLGSASPIAMLAPRQARRLSQAGFDAVLHFAAR